ncbi:MAG: redox-regulated ATPase YchF [Deltaproteobacteria bacterium CG11_big_fil_rev_8_21_14_0_20_49_13]|nr:MAG: redox-regulated ATPase YchF [Deltaproteobacteria bacterium CG11_big_fil_rev_8_21_14_0_20_49_13]
MEIGIIGSSQSGKSTIFQIMTGVNSREIFGERFVKGTANIPDARFEKLVEIFKPAKVSPAVVPFTDVNLSGKEAWDKARNGLSGADGFLHIIDAFTTQDVAELAKSYRSLTDDLILADLIVVENRLERLQKTKASVKPEDAIHAKVLPHAKELLENGKLLRELKLSQDEFNSLKGFTFWTIRPELVVLNIAEDIPHDVIASASEAISSMHSGNTSNIINICCQIELEIAALPPAERGEFLASMNIKEPAFERIIKASFASIGRMFYFTVGEDEVKAWVVPTNSTAPKAASAIHKDFERGFIKAEVVGYDDFINCGGTLAGAKQAGKFRLEGKEYIVKDGDIINFRFNV